MFLRETVQTSRNLIIKKIILAFIAKYSCGFVTSKFREDEINEIYSGEQRMWVEMLNKSCEFPIEIKKGCVLGFFVAEPNH